MLVLLHVAALHSHEAPKNPARQVLPGNNMLNSKNKASRVGIFDLDSTVRGRIPVPFGDAAGERIAGRRRIAMPVASNSARVLTTCQSEKKNSDQL
jgi:hypothetical protein